MQSVIRGIVYIISFVLLIVGIINVMEQLKLGDEISWPLPIIFICFGVGLPIMLFAYPDMFTSETEGGNAECGEDEGYSDSGGSGD